MADVNHAYSYSVVLVWRCVLAAASRWQPRGRRRIVLVADSRRFTGWEAWWANLYNESHLYFALLTIIIVPVLALSLGKLTDWFWRAWGST